MNRAQVFVGYNGPVVWTLVIALCISIPCALFEFVRRFFVTVPVALIVCWAIFAAVAHGKSSGSGGSGIGSIGGITIVAAVVLMLGAVIVWASIKEVVSVWYIVFCACYVLVLTPMAFWSGDLWESRYVLAYGKRVTHTQNIQSSSSCSPVMYAGIDYLYIFAGMAILLVAKAVYYFYEHRILRSVFAAEHSCCFECCCGCCPDWCCTLCLNNK